MAELETASLDSVQNTGTEGGEVSAEDLVRVNEQLGESKKYRGMIGSSVAANNKLAEFLKYLIIQINDNAFWDTIECFYVRPDLGELMFLSNTFCACMFPLFEQKADELEMNKAFPVDYHIMLSFREYLEYVQNVFAHDTESRKVDEKKLIVFLKLIVKLRNISVEEGTNLEHVKIHILEHK